MKTTNEIKIDKGIPLPVRARYPFSKMEVGDSCLIKGKKSGDLTGCFHPLMKKHGFRFSTRTVDGGLRVWRVQ